MAEHASKDLIFLWEGTDKRGVHIKGESKGASIALIKADLRRQGINPLKVKKKPKPLFSQKKQKITPKDIAVFSRQLATMMASGVPLVQSFEKPQHARADHGHQGRCGGRRYPGRGAGQTPEIF